MSEHHHPDQSGGCAGGATEGGPGPGPGGPAGYGFHPGIGPWGGYPPGPMGGPGPVMGPQPGYGYGYGLGPMGPPPGYGPGYGGPVGGPGFEQAGSHGPPCGGQGGGPSMDRIFEELSNGGGLGGLGKLLDFDDTEFWKGALVGAAAVLLLTNESVQQSLFKSGIKARDAVEKGLGSLRGEGETGDENEKPAQPAATRKTARKKKDSSS